jgi:hypothetical protein
MTIVRRKIASEINVKSGSARGLYASRGFAVAEGKKRPIIWNAAKGTLIRGVTPDVFGKDRHGRFHRPDRVRCYGRSRFRAHDQEDAKELAALRDAKLTLTEAMRSQRRRSRAARSSTRMSTQRTAP